MRNRLKQSTLSNMTQPSQLFESLIVSELETKSTLAEKLKYSVSYINKLMKQRKIPFLKNGKAVRFKFSEVVAALEQGSTV